MISIADLTDEQAIALTDKDIQDIIDYECALRGLPLLPTKPEKLQYEKPKKDVTIYKIGDYKFLDKEEAQQVLDTLLQCESITSTTTDNWEDYTLCPLNSYSTPCITTENVYSEELYESIQNELINYKNQKKEFEKLTSEYNVAYDNIAGIREELNDVINNAKEHFSKVKKYSELLERYLQLSDGDMNVAKNFLIDAHPDAEQYEEITSLWEV